MILPCLLLSACASKSALTPKQVEHLEACTTLGSVLTANDYEILNKRVAKKYSDGRYLVPSTPKPAPTQSYPPYGYTGTSESATVYGNNGYAGQYYGGESGGLFYDNRGGSQMIFKNPSGGATIYDNKGGVKMIY